MPQKVHIANDLSSRRIVGFACNQGFVFFLFYMGSNRSYQIGSFVFERAELFCTLAFMVVGFALVRAVKGRARNVVLSKPFLFMYAVIMVLGSLISSMATIPLYWLPIESMLLGATNALMLTAWGRAFGRAATGASVPEVFIGSLIGALVCLAFSLAQTPEVLLVLRALPIASAALIEVPSSASSPQNAGMPKPDVNSDTVLLSLKIVAGTLLFGMAAGFMETFGTDPGAAAMPNYPISMMLFGAFLMGALSLLLSDGFGKGAALNKSYRLAVFVMLLGIICIPSQVSDVLPAEAIVLAGYLGLEAVLISLFLVLAQITGIDAASAFTRGFLALFAGELIGVGCANLFDSVSPGGVTPYDVVVFAGVLVLFSYVFLFTEHDFKDLSEMVTDTDSFQEACKSIEERFGLSAREAEILPLALRGRTSQRISEELSISKSTVDTHLRRIYTKCGVHGRQELIDLGEASGGRLK